MKLVSKKMDRVNKEEPRTVGYVTKSDPETRELYYFRTLADVMTWLIHDFTSGPEIYRLTSNGDMWLQLFHMAYADRTMTAVTLRLMDVTPLQPYVEKVHARGVNVIQQMMDDDLSRSIQKGLDTSLTDVPWMKTDLNEDV